MDKEQLVERLLWKAGGLYSYPKVPGIVIESLSPEERTVVKELTSEDFWHRMDKWLA
jgi:hypothetical protein